MLSSKMTATVLYVTPAIKHLVGTYKKKIGYLMSFDYNVSCGIAEVVFDEIINARRKIDNLLAFEDAVKTAVGLLPGAQREVIEAFYFKGWNKEKVARKLGIPVRLASSRRNYAFYKLRNNVELLGFSESRIIDYFNSEQVFIDVCAKVSEMQSKTCNFAVGETNDEKRKFTCKPI